MKWIEMRVINQSFKFSNFKEMDHVDRWYESLLMLFCVFHFSGDWGVYWIELRVHGGAVGDWWGATRSLIIANKFLYHDFSQFEFMYFSPDIVVCWCFFKKKKKKLVLQENIMCPLYCRKFKSFFICNIC